MDTARSGMMSARAMRAVQQVFNWRLALSVCAAAGEEARAAGEEAAGEVGCGGHGPPRTSMSCAAGEFADSSGVDDLPPPQCHRIFVLLATVAAFVMVSDTCGLPNIIGKSPPNRPTGRILA